MITTVDECKVVKSGNVKSKDFSIQASAKAFTILSSGLYSNKPESIVRELATNAYDAHVAAGKADVPIKVFGPSMFSQNFSVEDFGNGIDPDEFERIYTTYFFSTKTKTNDQVGCFGLGSKSPFAYTDQFTVENCWNGVMYLYSCYKSSEGQPAVSLLMQKPSEKKSGIKVTFPIRSSDNYLFNNAISAVLPWFSVKPESNVTFSTLAKEEKVFKATVPNKYSASGCYLRMGNVVYPISSPHFQSIFSYGQSFHIIINVNVGDVDVTPSRESLELTEKTNKTIESLKDVLKDFFLKDIKQIEDDQSLSKFQRFKQKYEYIKSFNFATSFMQNPNRFCEIDEEIPFSCYTNGYYSSRLISDTFNHSVRADSTIIIDDLKRGIQTRLREFKKENPNAKSIFVFKEESVKQLIDDYDFVESDFIKASTIEIPKNSSSRSSNKTNCTRIIHGNRSGFLLDKNVKGGVYVLDTELLMVAMHKLQYFDKLKNQGVYVFTENQFNKLKIKDREFVTLYDFLKEEIKGVDEDNYRMSFIQEQTYHRLYLDSFVKLAKLCPQSDELKNITKNFNASSFDSSKVHKAKQAFEIMYRLDSSSSNPELVALENAKAKAIRDFNIAVETIWKKYPLLKKLLDNFSMSDIIGSVAEYINLIDLKGTNP